MSEIYCTYCENVFTDDEAYDAHKDRHNGCLHPSYQLELALVRIAELEARINTDTCLVCGHTSVTDIESPCPVCDLAKANKRIAELEAANVEWQHCPHCGATILAAENK